MLLKMIQIYDFTSSIFISIANGRCNALLLMIDMKISGHFSSAKPQSLFQILFPDFKKVQFSWFNLLWFFFLSALK